MAFSVRQVTKTNGHQLRGDAARGLPRLSDCVRKPAVKRGFVHISRYGDAVSEASAISLARTRSGRSSTTKWLASTVSNV
jgi:hypothetical protein